MPLTGSVSSWQEVDPRGEVGDGDQQPHHLLLRAEAHAHGGREHDQCGLAHLGRHLRQNISQRTSTGIRYSEHLHYPSRHCLHNPVGAILK